MDYSSLMGKRGYTGGQITAIVLAVLIVTAVRGLIVMWLWNILATGLFAAQSINFLEALGLIALVAALRGVSGTGSK